MAQKFSRDASKRILLVGAHITPAIALIQELSRLDKHVTTCYVGRQHTGAGPAVDRQEVERVGSTFLPLQFWKFHRYVTPAHVLDLLKVPSGFLRANRIVMTQRPAVVVSLGGYLSIPIALCAWVRGIPIVVHEQTTAWGAANRLIVPIATVKAVSWPSLLRPGVILTGNPLRREILNAKRLRQANPSSRVLYVSGGNQGSLTIDSAIEPLLPRLAERFTIYHQTKRPVRFHHPRYVASAWFDSTAVAQILRRTTISISRAGANTVSELLYLGIPALFIPLPFAGSGEQLKNAQLATETGLGKILTQDLLSPETLLEGIFALDQIPREQLRASRLAAASLIRPNAAHDLATIIQQTTR